MKPSPAPKLIAPDPRLWGQRAARQARNAGHPCQPFDWATEERTTVLLALSPAEVARLRTMCSTSPHAEDQALGEGIRRQMHGRAYHEPDPTPAYGTRRPH